MRRPRGGCSFGKGVSTGTWVNDLAIGDFNGDGSPDIVYAGLGGVYLLGSNP